MRQWNVSHGEFRVYLNESSRHEKCYFRILSLHTWRNFSYLGQTFNLEDYSLLISSDNAQYHASARFQCSGKHHASITIRHIDENNLVGEAVEAGNEFQMNKLLFFFSSNRNYSWCKLCTIANIFKYYSTGYPSSTDNYRHVPTG